MRTLIRGIRDTYKAKQERHKKIHAFIKHPEDFEGVDGQIFAVADTVNGVQSRIKKCGGGHVDIEWGSRNFKEVYRDECTNEVLPKELIHAAIQEELSYFNQHVWEVTDKEGMKQLHDAKLVRCRWVLCYKGDAGQPDVRARLVACEVNYGGTKEDNFYAATPPLEAKKMLFAKFADAPTLQGVRQRLSFVDIRKAYFNGIPRRNIFMSLPRELGLPGHWVGRQVRCVYGTRDAGAIWEDTYRDALEALGFTSGRASPCVFHHKGKNITTVVHGDDFTCLASDVALDWLESELAKHFELKIKGRLGVGVEGENEIQILNRIIRITDEGLEYEADPRHVDHPRIFGARRLQAHVDPRCQEPDS